ncbi:MAG: hypothetical protein JXQ71_10255 [Verrucomicrobia bacterium]|nr:hypothetical protein [Verrucomicrobiota bacterium]
MNTEFELQLQAYLDGELPQAEARAVSARLQGDPTARTLLSELTTTKRWLAGNEPPVHVPESREFYWSKIDRALDRIEKAAAAAAGDPRPDDPLTAPACAYACARALARLFQPRSWRFLAPAAGAVLAVGLALLLFKPGTPAPADDPDHYMTETETLSEDTTAFAFRSQRDNMFVVWISNKESPSSPEDELPADVDMYYQ